MLPARDTLKLLANEVRISIVRNILELDQTGLAAIAKEAGGALVPTQSRGGIPVASGCAAHWSRLYCCLRGLAAVFSELSPILQETWRKF